MAEFDFWVAMGIKIAHDKMVAKRDAEAMLAASQALNPLREEDGVDHEIEWKVWQLRSKPGVHDRIEQFMRENPHIIAVDNSHFNWEYGNGGRMGLSNEDKTSQLLVTLGRRSEDSFNHNVACYWHPDQIYLSEDVPSVDEAIEEEVTRVPKKNRAKS